MKKLITIILCLIMIMPAAANAAVGSLDDTMRYISAAVPEPTVGSIGGEWAVIGLVRGGMDASDGFFQKYLSNARKYVREKNGVLHTKKYTEYSRVTVALAALGENPQDFEGFDLTKPLLDYESTVQQGINGAIWALIALDCIGGGAEIKQQYADCILSRQNKDGGWALSGEDMPSEADITAMAVTALSRHCADAKINAAAERALSYLSSVQSENGGFEAYGEETAESAAQVLTAISSMGISYNDDSFVKNGKTIVDNIYSFKNADGSFCHTYEPNLMATEQCCYALAAAKRAEEGKTALFDMSDVVKRGTTEPSGGGTSEVQFPDKSFADIKSHKNQAAIEALAQRGIVNGMNETDFAPDATMTRAEFAAIIVRALKLPLQEASSFSDVTPSDWHSAYVGAAYSGGIVIGAGGGLFAPDRTISVEQALVMVQRAAELCGKKNTLDFEAIRNILAEFTDYTTVSDWARAGAAFCYENGIADRSEIEIRPHEAVKRCEVAQMIYNLLKGADLI